MIRVFETRNVLRVDHVRAIVAINEESLKTDLCKLVRKTAKDALNSPLEEEAGDLIVAECYERTAEREAYRAGNYDRSLVTTSGKVTLHMPKLKGVRLACASTKRIEDVNEIGVMSAETFLLRNEANSGDVIARQMRLVRPYVVQKHSTREMLNGGKTMRCCIE